MPANKDKKTNKWIARGSYVNSYGERKHIMKRGFERKKDALDWLDDTLAKIKEDGERLEGLSFSFLADDYLRWYKPRRKKSSYDATYNIVINHLKPYFKNIDVHKMKSIDVSRFHDQKLEEGLEASYLLKIHTYLTAVIKHGQKFYDVKQNVASLTGNFEKKKKKHVDYWTLEEFNQFIEVIEDIKHKTFFSMLYYTGARKGEIRALRWNDVEDEFKSIRIDKTDYNGVVTSPKSSAGERTVLLPDELIKQLKEYKSYYENSQIYKPEYVIFGEFYKSVSDSTVDRWYDKYIKLAEIKHRIRIHDFRHSHASHLINLGAPPLIVAQRLGHSDASLVLNTYGHLYPSTQESIIELLNTSVNETKTKDFDPLAEVV